MPEPKFFELQKRLAQVNDLQMAAALLAWDQETYMPPGGANARARQLAALYSFAHELFTDARVGQLLDDLTAYETSLPYDSDDASLLRVARREYKRLTRVPAEFVARRTQTAALSYNQWVKVRPESDFDAVAPWLERILDLSREYASFFPGSAHPADALIEGIDPGMSAVEIRRVFRELRAQLVPLVRAITAQPPADASCLKQFFPKDEQLRFGLRMAQCFGYDLERGRQDQSAHPFMTHFSIGDVRITTRVKEHDFGEAFFSTLHEAGHAMYGQGHALALEGTLLAEGASSGVHESQSRLWENLVGRSAEFWEFAYPELQAAFPSQFGSVPSETFYRAINKVERSLIRTDADEVTYNLHIMMRFEFEMQMLEGKLAIRDLPDAWDEIMTRDIGVTPPNDALGVMQDVHWYGGQIGGVFQGYTLGNLMSAQFFDAARRVHPTIPDEIRRGEFAILHGWLAENIYRHGAKFLPNEILERATGAGLQVEPYIAYLREKYRKLYAL
jgi:carboxypeptidase Taq